MKIEVSDNDLEPFVKAYIEELVKMSKTKFDYAIDQEYWDEIGEHAAALLALNWPSGRG